MIKNNVKFIILAALILMLGHSETVAAPGDLDLTFGSGGKLSLPVTGWLTTNRTLLQGDGKFLTLIFDDGPSERYAFRNFPNGTFDPALSANSFLGIDWADMVVLNDGKFIAIGGSSYLAGDGVYRSEFATLRFDSNGTLDTSFAAGGTVTTRIAVNSVAQRVTPQADGKIVVSGIATDNPVLYPATGAEYKIALVRYNPDGTPDQSFGTNGTVVVAGRGTCTRIVAQPDNKLLCANGSEISRYNANGVPDAEFGTNGIIDIRTSSTGIALQSDGRIVVSGNDGTFSTIKRFSPNGTSDNSFGTNGSITVANAIWRDHPALALAIQPNGRILAAGNLNGRAIISRYTQNGNIDTTFGTNGNVTPSFEHSYRTGIKDLIIQPDNKIVATGSVEVGSYYTSSPLIMRFIGDPATNLTVSGRVLTPNGIGLRNAGVTLTDQQGIVRRVTTSSFGSYAFDNVEAGSSYTISVSSRRYRFTPLSLQVNSTLANIDFLGAE